MRRIAITALSASLAIGAAACSNKSPSGPDDASLNPPADPPTGIVVSNALASSSTGSSFGVRTALGVSANAVAYVSAVPGTFAGAASAAIRNQTRSGPSLPIQVMDGGFDPVGVDAEKGDELSLTVFERAGGSTVRAVKVPARRRPGVVRTNPAKGRTDVALNVQVLVVFSEPVDKSSVTSLSVSLLSNCEPGVCNGSDPPGHVEVAADGLSAEFIPDGPLQPETGYSLVIKETIRDLDGDSLVPAPPIAFSTVAETSNADLMFVRRSDRQIYLVNSYRFSFSAGRRSGQRGRISIASVGMYDSVRVFEGG